MGDQIRFSLILFSSLFFIQFGYVKNVKAQPDKISDDRSTQSSTGFFEKYKYPSNKSDINEYSFWGGYSFHSSNGVWGKTSGAKLSVLGLRYNRRLLQFPRTYLLKYVVEMNIHVQYQLTEVKTTTTPSSISGFGMTPVGFQLNWIKNRWIQPFFKSSAGFMYLSNPFPNDLGTNFNFTLEIGTGLDIPITEHTILTLGYKYHHMSNGETGQVNPGVDSNIFYGGFTIY